VEEAMSRGPLRTVTPATPVEKAAELLAVERMHRIPVVDDGHLVGIVSTMDVVRAVADRKLSHTTFVFPSQLSLS
jgi:CBS domain-containing protein